MTEPDNKHMRVPYVTHKYSTRALQSAAAGMRVWRVERSPHARGTFSSHWDALHTQRDITRASGPGLGPVRKEMEDDCLESDFYFSPSLHMLCVKGRKDSAGRPEEESLKT